MMVYFLNNRGIYTNIWNFLIGSMLATPFDCIGQFKVRLIFIKTKRSSILKYGDFFFDQIVKSDCQVMKKSE
jgi:hypothetical protein